MYISSFNTSLILNHGLINVKSKLVQEEKGFTRGGQTSGIAHDIKNPLN